ncbi:MAG: hypothetical protein NZ937_07145, partial [Armatimonadetes bacterium]|nr:hypothetical protein [Armatimonadota bacterium]
FFVTATFASAFYWLKRKSVIWAILTGLTAGLTFWLAFKNAVPLACIAFWLLWENFKGENRLPSSQIALSVVLALSPYLLSWLLFGFQPLETFKAASAAHHVQAGSQARSYLPWVFVNLADFGMGIGGAWLGLLAIYLSSWRKNPLTPSLTVATLIVLIVLDFSGLVRGEVARLWIPFIPLLTIELVKVLTQSSKDVALMAFLQGSVALTLHIQLEFLRPF